MAFGRLQTVHSLYRTLEIRGCSYSLGSSRSFSNFSPTVPKINCWSNSSCLVKDPNALLWTFGSKRTLRSTVVAELSIFLSATRLVTTQAKAPPQVRQMGALKVSMTSPGIIYEPYAPREPISFWRRWFTRSGWRRTKEDIILELKSAYAIAKLRKSGYSKQKFYQEALDLYKLINTQMADGDKTSLRRQVTDKMFSALKNEIKQRESLWNKVYWELVEPVVKIRTLRARLIGVDRNDTNKVFIQLTLEFLTKQKFEAYDSKGAVVAGDKNRERLLMALALDQHLEIVNGPCSGSTFVLVRDIWVFEKSLFHTGAYWRLCGRIPVQAG